MHVTDLSPQLVTSLGGIVGFAGGVLAIWLADTLPRLYGLTCLAEGRARTLRNVVLLVATTTAVAGIAYSLTRPSTSDAGPALFQFAVDAGMCVALLAAAAVDVEHMILPNEITLGGAAMGLVTATWRDLGLTNAVGGAVVGFLVSYLPAVLYRRMRGIPGVGLGDTKLSILAGAWLGPAGAVFVLFAGALQTVAGALFVRATGFTMAVPDSVRAQVGAMQRAAGAGDGEAVALLADDPMATTFESTRELATQRLPMGPFMVLGCLEFLFARRHLLLFFERYIAPE